MRLIKKWHLKGKEMARRRIARRIARLQKYNERDTLPGPGLIMLDDNPLAQRIVRRDGIIRMLQNKLRAMDAPTAPNGSLAVQ